MRRSARRFVVGLVVAAALYGVFASSAIASLETTPTPTLATSHTNPGAGADYWWRGDWGNSLNPDFELMVPTLDPETEGYLLGSIYAVNGLAGTVIDTSTPSQYYRDSFPVGSGVNGTNFDDTIDLLGVSMNLLPGQGPAPVPGIHSPLEGWWYYHYCFYSNQRYQYGQWDIPFGVDVTPPRAVNGLSVSSGLLAAPYDPNVWAPTSRGLVRWTGAQYDDLSGVGYYQVLIDDQPVLPEKDEIPVQGRAYAAQWLPTPNSITIESLPPGRHKLSVFPVDRATNKGPATSVWYQSDPDTPTISWGPLMGDTLTSAAHMIYVDAADSAGNPFVSFSIDGSVVGTAAAPPYAVTPNLNALTQGPHNLTATVTDMLGRQVTITKAVTWTSNGYVVVPPGGSSLDASGAVGDEFGGASSTNPVADFSVGDITSDRQGWGNSLFPDFDLTYPGSAEGFLYDVVTTTASIDPSHPDNYYRASRPSGTHMFNTIDLQGIYSYPPPGGWRPGPVAGSSKPIEGKWYLEFVFYDRQGHVSSHTFRVPFGIDLTPPSTVTGLHVVPTLETTGTGSVSGTSRAHIAWDQGAWDSLSGVSYYKVLVDGDEVMPADGIVWDIPGAIPNAVTIENLSPGKHVIGVQAVDRATNSGIATTTEFYSDPDTPTVTIAKPTGSVVGVKPTIAAIVGDLGGVKSVVFKLDGVTLGSVLKAPYSIAPSLSSFSAGNHLLSVVGTDMLGRAVTATRTVTVDKTPLTVSSLKTSGSGRKVSVSFSVSRASTVKLSVPRTSATKTLTATSAGRYSFTYTYPKGRKYPSSTSFKDSFTLSASDSLGNAASASGKWTVTLARVVVSGNKVKIVYY